MNDYLVPRAIAEALGLVRLRKSTPQGLFLLSESDLVGYGLQKAIDEGAIVLSTGGIRVQPDSGSDDSSGGSSPSAGQELEPEPEVENNENEEEESV